MASKKRGRSINVKAKKYTTVKSFKYKDASGEIHKISLRDKTRLANSYLKQAKDTLGSTHKSYIATMAKIHTFQKKHWQTRQGRLSMTDLRTGDIDMYDNLLDSIIESTYMNPEKYATHTKNQTDYFMSQGWGKTEAEVKDYIDFKTSDVFEEIVDLNIPPSSLFDKAAEYAESDLTIEDFKKTIRTFMKSNRVSGIKKDEAAANFFAYADDYMMLKEERPDLDKAYEEYMSLDTTETFFEFLDRF